MNNDNMTVIKTNKDGDRIDVDARFVRKGDVIKVRLPIIDVEGHNGMQGEWPWAEVVAVVPKMQSEPYRFVAKLANDPMSDQHGLSFGDIVVFEQTSDDEGYQWLEPPVAERLRIAVSVKATS